METTELVKVDYSWHIPYDTVMGDTYAVFMAGMRDKTLKANVCRGCNGVHFPPKPFCDLCYEECADWVEIDDTAELITYAVCYVPFPDLPNPPSITGIMKMGNSIVNFVHNIDGIDKSDPSKIDEQLKVGMKLKPVWKEQRKGHMFDIDYFKPA
ncbi:Zn-ribbon domain-containing OB-fold protein [Spongiibacter marinus]|uniref:Zn-ribbon domain-containing OB-fold protein n=1 Tax=Spongiibacter marinus TaxID=354246 RepID=UPI0035BE9E49